MSASPDRPPRRRDLGPSFRPRFTLMILYLALFFLGFALLLALPGLLEAFRTLPPSEGPLTPEELEVARRAAHEALRGRLGFAFLAAVAATGLGAWRGVLPGLRGALH
jgi:hypothetical protein